MVNMSFNNYVWRHNPESLQIRWENRLTEHMLPYVGSMLERVGQKYRVITGEGDFYGPDCYEQFSRLSGVFEQGGSGYLYIPAMAPVRAMFKALEMRCEPVENLIRYRFEFWEEVIESARTLRENGIHVVGQGESLWSIALQYGYSVDELIAMNPHIRDVLTLTPGERVRVR